MDVDECSPPDDAPCAPIAAFTAVSSESTPNPVPDADSAPGMFGIPPPVASLPNMNNASNNTMEMASFKSDSPSTTACRSGSKPMSLKMLRVVTGSVDEISDPNNMASRKVYWYASPAIPAPYMMNPTTSVDTNVPRKAKTLMASKFRNSVSGFNVYPLSNITGGSNTRKKNSVSNLCNAKHVKVNTIAHMYENRK